MEDPRPVELKDELQTSSAAESQVSSLLGSPSPSNISASSYQLAAAKFDNDLANYLRSDAIDLPDHELSGTVSHCTTVPDRFTSTSLLAAVLLLDVIEAPDSSDTTVGELLKHIANSLPLIIQEQMSPRQAKFTIGISFAIENPDRKDDTTQVSPRFLLATTINHNDLTLQAHYDASSLTRIRVLRFLWNISSVHTHLLDSDSSNLTESIPRLSLQDLETITNWNSKTPLSRPICVHESVTRWANQTPLAEAIDGWDRHLSFSELDRLSTKLAGHLLRFCSIKPGDIIPLCIGRSAIAIVSMLAVMKAGGAFVPLDPLGPKDRNLEIMSICGAEKLILASYDEKYEEVGLVVSWTLIDALPSTSKVELPTVTPGDLAYVIFTSGSTGKPKGVMIEHQNLFYSLGAHGGDIYRQGPTSRVLQFAALTFDASMTEHLAPLTLGGCVCVPDHEIRLTAIADYINSRSVNWAFFTPTFFKLLSPEDVPCLKTVVLGGEAITNDCIDRWSHRIRLINGYGPSEGTIVATACVVEPMSSERASIGRALVCKSWIVDPEDHSRLLPVGAIGELVLQGPTVARGYLNEPEKTEAAFIDVQPWASDSDNPQDQRMYKTGDLVRYDENGSLIYLGRKDTQVKIRGQRLELGEVENHLPADTIQHGVALVPKSGLYKGRLVVVVVCRTRKDSAAFKRGGFWRLSGETAQEAQEIINDTKESMLAKVPGFAIPDIWIPVDEIPTSKSGKLDRMAVRSWVESLGGEQQPESEIDDEDDPTATDLDRIIQEAFGHALGLPARRIPLDCSFQSLGGDSLQAIQVVGRCRAQSLQISILPILKGDTIRQLSSKSNRHMVASQGSECIDTPFPLSPIQRLYVDANPPSDHHFNQTRVVRLKKPLRTDILLEALRHVVRTHSMLRARLVRDNAGNYHQLIKQEADIDFRCSSVASLEEAQGSIAASQQAVNICSGPVVAAHHILVENELPLFSITVAHFSIDIVSWGIIFEDLGACLQNNRLPPPTSLSFQNWCRQQTENLQGIWSKQHLLPVELPKEDVDSCFSFPKPNTYGDVVMQKTNASLAATSSILSACGSSSLSVLDLLLAVLFRGFADTFPTLQLPVIHSESHGRQTWTPEQDISRTVGWFTSLTPILAPTAHGDDIWHAARSIRHYRGQLLHGGLPFFASRFRSDAQGSERKQPMAVVFNYMGQEKQRADSDDAPFVILPEFQGESGDDASANMPRFSVFEISAEIRHGQIRVTFTWPEGLECGGCRDDVSSLVDRCRDNLESAGAGKSQSPTRSLVSSSCDLYQLQVDYDTSWSILRNAEEKLSRRSAGIAKISPTSATQRAILLSQEVNPRMFQTRLVFSVQTRAQLDISNLLSAWNQVVGRHGIFRTVFVRRPGEHAAFDQVLLEHIEPQVETLADQRHTAQSLLQLPSGKWEEHEPHHRLTVAHTATSQTLLLLECSHAMIDYASLQIVFQDLSTAYGGFSEKAEGDTVQFVDLVDYRSRAIKHESDLFWQTLFMGGPRGQLSHGRAPQSMWKTHQSLTFSLDAASRAALQALCQRTSTTMALIVRFAWAAVLSQFLNSKRVAFGYVVAGRDIDLTGIEGIVGPCLNILGCVVELGEGEDTTAKCLEMLKEQFLNSLSHQYGYLDFSASHSSSTREDRSTMTPTTAHFDTLVNFRSHNELKESADALRLQVEGEIDPFDYALVVEADSYSTGDLHITLSFWEEAIGGDLAKEVSAALARVLEQIPQTYDNKA
ncbi:acetyl-CoA synthetase-like protein [Ustulina deusta]|nr:acetyl-CoA synthetase-like protein [Ustulina deusta]